MILRVLALLGVKVNILVLTELVQGEADIDLLASPSGFARVDQAAFFLPLFVVKHQSGKGNSTALGADEFGAAAVFACEPPSRGR